MSLAARAAAAKITPKTTARILILDIERLPGQATHHHRGLTITGPFWDLNGWKSTIGYRLPPESVTEWPRTICIAWAWYDKPRDVHFAAEWEQGGRHGMARAAWDAYDEADIVVGHNMAGFDAKHLKADWAELGLPSPRPWQTVDTLKVARSEFRFESNKLDALCKRLGVPAKTDKYDPTVAQRAVDGHGPSQKRIRKYNIGDIHATRALYDRLRPWIKGHPNLGLWSDARSACPNCGGEKFEQMGDVTTPQTRYGALRCAHCEAPLRRTHLKQRVELRPAR